MNPEERLNRQSFERRKKGEEKNEEIEEKRGERPLEGFSGGGAGTTWSERQEQTPLFADEELPKDEER